MEKDTETRLSVEDMIRPARVAETADFGRKPGSPRAHYKETDDPNDPRNLMKSIQGNLDGQKAERDHQIRHSVRSRKAFRFLLVALVGLAITKTYFLHEAWGYALAAAVPVTSGLLILKWAIRDSSKSLSLAIRWALMAIGFSYLWGYMMYTQSGHYKIGATSLREIQETGIVQSGSPSSYVLFDSYRNKPHSELSSLRQHIGNFKQRSYFNPRLALLPIAKFTGEHTSGIFNLDLKGTASAYQNGLTAFALVSAGVCITLCLRWWRYPVAAPFSVIACSFFFVEAGRENGLPLAPILVFTPFLVACIFALWRGLSKFAQSH